MYLKFQIEIPITNHMVITRAFCQCSKNIEISHGRQYYALIRTLSIINAWYMHIYLTVFSFFPMHYVINYLCIVIISFKMYIILKHE
jgi:hypothetical protein